MGEIVRSAIHGQHGETMKGGMEVSSSPGCFKKEERMFSDIREREG
jgi:hypothetical protein